MEPGVRGSPQAACVYPPAYREHQGQEGRAPFRGQADPICPVPPWAERDVECAHGLYMTVGWVTGSRRGWFRRWTQKGARPCSTHIAWDPGIYCEMAGHACSALSGLPMDPRSKSFHWLPSTKKAKWCCIPTVSSLFMCLLQYPPLHAFSVLCSLLLSYLFFLSGALLS